jgi:uncharacterized protein
LAPRVSLLKEKLFWETGVHSWEQFSCESKHETFLAQCTQELKAQNCSFFANHLKSDQHWRLFGEFQHSVAYVDIETTGLSKHENQITTIALYDGQKTKTYVNGKNLNEFISDLSQYQLLITFNGKTFDVPFIEHFFGVKIAMPHIDLRYVMKRLGLAGGLKSIERQLGLDRAELSAVDGFFAVFLWREFKRSNHIGALETLLAYNCADVLNLEHLMIHAYNQNIKETPFYHLRKITMPQPKPIPFQADKTLLRKYGCL